MRVKGTSSSHSTKVRSSRTLITNESYSLDGVRVLRERCRLLRQEIIHIGNIDVFLESVTRASACKRGCVNGSPHLT